jgi:hypothetical protein
MRIVKGLTVLAIVLMLASPAKAADPLAFIGSLFNSQPGTSTQPPISQPMIASPGPSGLTNMLPKTTLPSNSPVVGYSVFPTQSQMPGLGYLQAFGYQHPTPVDTFHAGPPRHSFWIFHWN